MAMTNLAVQIPDRLAQLTSASQDFIAEMIELACARATSSRHWRNMRTVT